MPLETSDRLVRFSKDSVGNSLRTVVVLYEDDFEVVYLNDRLREKYSSDYYEQVVDSFRVELGESFYEATDSQIGSKNCLVHSHENAFIFQFPHEDCHSILLSVDPAVGSELNSFIERCRDKI